MDKENVLKEVGALIRSGRLSKKELMEIYNKSIGSDKDDALSKQSKISDILYFLGGAVVVLGICIFVGTNWGNLNSFTKVLVTLGSSAMMYIAGALLGNDKKLRRVCDAFYFIAGLAGPLGIFVTMDVFGMDIDSAGSHTFVAAIVFSVNALSYYINRRNVFFMFSVLLGSWLFFALTTFLIGGRPFDNWDFIKYRWLMAGLAHMFLGYALVDTDKKVLTPRLYSVGVIEFLTAAFVLGGWSVHQNMFWELMFPGLAFGVIFLSVYLKEKVFLSCGTLYLMVYILKITNEYFASGFGWALSLIVVGFALIGIGYYAFHINKKYICSLDG